jgi:competence protein ComEC
MKFRPRLPFVGLVFGAVIGIVAAEHWRIPSAWALGTTAILALITWRTPRTWLAISVAAGSFFFLHTLRHFESPARVLAKEFTSARTVDAEGVVWDEPRSIPEDESTFLMRAVLPGEKQRDAGFIRVRTVGSPPGCGDRIRIRGIVSLPKPPRNPGEFDMAAWSERQGISFELRCETPEDLQVLEREAGRWAARLATRARIWVRTQLSSGVEISADEVALVESMVLGVNAETPPEMRELFQKTGTLHLLAVSGLNVAMLATIVLTLLRPFRVPHTSGVVITILVLAAYALITGLSPSCTRAALMAALLLAAPCFDRSANSYNSLAAAAFVLLALDTNQLFSIGFQLSFVIVLVIFFTARRVQEIVKPWANPDAFIPDALWSPAQRFRVWVWRGFAAAVGVNIASWTGSLFFMAGYFHLVSPASIVANFIAVGMAFCILALGLASVISSAVPFVSVLFNHANVLCAGSLLKVIAAFAQIPYGHMYVEIPQRGPMPVCELTILDVGEGAAAHVRTSGVDWLIDTGHIRDYQRTVAPYLRSRGINALDYLLLTHGDASHIGGASPVLLQFSPEHWIEARPLDRSPTRRATHLELAQKNRGRILCATGDVWKNGDGATMRVLFPPAGLDRTRADDQAVVLTVECAGRRVLLMSDAGFFTEQWLMENIPDLHADIVVKGWHDKDPVSSPDFFARVAPRLVIAGDQRFGTPKEKTAAWADSLRAEGIEVFLQADTGAVRAKIFSDGSAKIAGHIPGSPSFALPPR